jgi:hypothetical protein
MFNYKEKIMSDSISNSINAARASARAAIKQTL